MATSLIRLTLLEGDPDGLRTAEIAGRTTKLIACPVASLEKLLRRPESNRTAVYFLHGEEYEPPSDAIYVGECDAVSRRFNGQHHAMEKAEWRQLVVAFSSDAIFNKAHARRAEHLLTERARVTARAKLFTERSGPGELDEGDTAFAEQFVADVVTLAEILGFPAFRATGIARQPARPLGTATTAATAEDDALFRYTGEAKYEAHMRIEGDEFVVLANSKARADETPGCADSIRALRTRAKEAGVLVADQSSTSLTVTRDFPVGSTSAAGGLIGGRNSRGPNEWVHVASGRTYAQWLSAKQQTAQPQGSNA